MRVLLIGGGTGGHITPILATAGELQKQKIKVLWVGSRAKNESEIARKFKIPFKSIFTFKLRRYFSPRTVGELFLIPLALFQAFLICQSFGPDIIFAKGGYVSLPIVLVGWLLGIQIVSHESDVVIGLANKITARVAKKICLGFPENYYQGLPKDKIVYTGIPLREEFINLSSTPLSFHPPKPSILIIGGSQGAHAINRVIFQSLDRLLPNYKIIHFSGHSDFPWLKKKISPGYQVFDFVDHPAKLMNKADLIITRCGATSLAEIASLGKPAILIPLPWATGAHQEKNSLIFKKAGAGVILKQEELSSKNLVQTINKLFSDRERLKRMGESAKSLAKPEATKLVVREILSQVR